MESSINLEARLLALDKELHAVLNLVREQRATEKKTGVVKETLGLGAMMLTARNLWRICAINFKAKSTLYF